MWGLQIFCHPVGELAFGLSSMISSDYERANDSRNENKPRR